MKRREKSHKGENGKVAVVGGSRHMHGAPLLCALACEASGTDLHFVCLPACHEEAAKQSSLNIQVYPFESDDLQSADTESILRLLATMDCAIIGPGISHDEKSVRAVKDIIAEATCPLVLDATALQPFTVDLIRNKPVVLTPHLGELERMRIDVKILSSVAKEAGVTIVLKGAVDHIVHSNGETKEIRGGNAGLTVGGTGDVLAGLIGGLIAQGLDHSVATETACVIMKQAGSLLFEAHGYAYTAKDVIGQIPHLLHTCTA